MLVRDVELLVVLFGRPEFDEPALMPLSELVAPGVPYPLVAAAGDMVVGVASVLLLWA
jgi:hypothetical protein